MNGTGYQTALVQELEKYNIAIAGLTEARLQDSDLSTVDGATFLHSGGHDRTQRCRSGTMSSIQWCSFYVAAYTPHFPFLLDLSTVMAISQ